jgi:hypothetical protein
VAAVEALDRKAESLKTPNAKFSGDEKRSFSDSAGTPG